ncbi:hypothetical protein [Labrenzia sp. CE80]|uniref:hypothetical protein n=1 Tax=Labrenzia sp. CE80 TaxID=1788986 RepID=UPI00129BE753|nr:hypothetical protein [Labrenzia sp. CE80]
MPIRTFADIEALSNEEKLTEAEQLLLDNCRIGKATMLGDGKRPSDPSPERTIRADLLRYLILGGCEQYKVHEWGVKLLGARISGSLDLSFATAKGATRLLHCWFEEPIAAWQAQFSEVDLNDSFLRGFRGQSALISGGVFLDNVRSIGMIDLNSAEVGGQLSCNGAELDGVGEKAVHAQGVTIGDGVYLRNLRAIGTINLVRADVDGQLSCTGAELDGTGDRALNAQGSSIRGGVVLRNLTSVGTVDFNRAEVVGQLSCDGAKLEGDGDSALHAQGVAVSAGVFLDNVSSTGTVDFAGAKIGGQLSCQGAELKGAGKRALHAQGATIKDGVFLRNLTSIGTVGLNGAEIGGQLSCNGVALNGNGEEALFGQRMIVKGGFYWRGVKSVAGAVDINSARLGDLADDAESWLKVSDLGFVGMTYDNLAGPLDLLFRKKWLRRGALFAGTFHPQPYQQLAKFFRETGHRREAREILIEKEIEERKDVRRQLRRKRSFLKALLHFCRTQEAHAVESTLRRTRAQNLIGGRELTELAHRFQSEGERGKQGDFLTEALKRDFHNQLQFEATLALLRGWRSNLSDKTSRAVAAYGYKPWLSLYWMAALLFLITFVAWETWGQGDFAPNSDVILTSSEWVVRADDENLSNPAKAWAEKQKPGQDYETFNPFFYAADVVIPIIDIGQTDAWGPSTNRGDWGRRLFYLQKCAIVLGWIFTAIFAAAVTGMIRRDD